MAHLQNVKVRVLTSEISNLRRLTVAGPEKLGVVPMQAYMSIIMSMSVQLCMLNCIECVSPTGGKALLLPHSDYSY